MQRNLDDQRKNLTSEQHPIAVILGCIDSRVPSELIFDLGLGDVFNIRIAGNILNEDILGSIEFACKVVGAKLIVVLGHSDCGAIKAACNSIKIEHMSSITDKINKVIQLLESQDTTREGFADEVTKMNTKYVKSEILKQSETVREMVSAGDLGIVSGVYHLESGVVHFDKEPC